MNTDNRTALQAKRNDMAARRNAALEKIRALAAEVEDLGSRIDEADLVLDTEMLSRIGAL